MKPLVIYHTNESTPCADGFGAAFAAWLKFGYSAEYLPMKYGQDVLDVDTYLDREIYILDFSFPRNFMTVLFAAASKVTWLDHHASVFKDWGKEPNEYFSDYIDEVGLGIEGRYAANHTVILDNMRSGALIAWEYFHPSEPAPALFRHLDDYDRWQFKHLFTKELAAALQACTPWDFSQWQEFLDSKAMKRLYTEGTALLKAQAVQVEAVVAATSTPCFFRIGDKTYEGLAANCPSHLTNEVGHALANKSQTYGMCWYQKSNGMIKVSLRSNGYNVLKLAKEYDGGGHMSAAGFEVTNVTLQDLLCPF